jgi:hypothetical protein
MAGLKQWRNLDVTNTSKESFDSVLILQNHLSTSLDNQKYFENGKGKSLKERSQIPPSF